MSEPNGLRIVYLHQYFKTRHEAGGTRSFEMARRLVAKGHTVHMITSVRHADFSSSGWQQSTESGIRVHAVPVPYSNTMSYRRRTVAFFRFALLAARRTAQLKPDVVFATSTPLTIAIPAIVAKLWHRVPMVFEVRDLWPELPIAVGALKNPIAQALARALEWLAYKSSAHIVALSPGMAQGVEKRGIPADKITVIPNCCDVELFDVPPSAGRHIRDRIPGLAEGDPLVVYTGTFGLINGVSYLVDVAAAMRSRDPDVRFLLVGAGAEWNKVVARAQALGLLGQTVWIWRPIPKAEMPSLLAAATVATSLVVPLPELFHNSANKFFDALAAGKPVAINYGGWQADLLQSTGAGVVLPWNDPRRAADILSSLVRDREQLQQAGLAARELAHTQFHRDAMAQRFEEVLRRAVNRDGRA